MKIGTEDAKKIGMGKILSGGMGVLSGLTAANPLVSGPFAMASGLFTIFEEYLDGDDESGLGEDAKEVLKEMVKKYTVRMKRDVQVLKNAIFGYTNYHTFTNERLVPDEFRDIPKEMQLKGGDPGVDDGWNHAITYVIGDGRWYVQEPAAGLSEKFGELYKRIVSPMNILLVYYPLT
jgi:hypothetical protein